MPIRKHRPNAKRKVNHRHPSTGQNASGRKNGNGSVKRTPEDIRKTERKRWTKLAMKLHPGAKVAWEDGQLLIDGKAVRYLEGRPVPVLSKPAPPPSPPSHRHSFSPLGQSHLLSDDRWN